MFKASEAAPLIASPYGRIGGDLDSGRPAEQPRNYAEFLGYFNSHPVAHRCLALNATTVAQGVLKWYRPSRRSSRADDEVDAHDIVALFERPNDIYTGREMLEHYSICAESTGNEYWELVRVGPKGSTRGRVIEMWPLNPSRMRVLPDPVTGVRGYAYTVNGVTIRYPRENILHIRKTNPGSDFYGAGDLEASDSAIKGDRLQAKLRNAILRNGAVLSGVMMMEPGFQQKQIDQAKLKFDQDYTGVDKAGQVLFLLGARKFERFTLTPQEMEDAQRRKDDRDDLMAQLGVWPVIYGVVDQSATRENATTQAMLYQWLTVMPSGNRFAGAVTHQLHKFEIPGTEGLYAKMDYSGTPIGRQILADSARSNAVLMDRGALLPNDLRYDLGLEPTEYGEAWWANSNLMAHPADGKIAQALDDVANALEMVVGLYEGRAA